MKKAVLLLVVVLLSSLSAFGAVFTINNTGLGTTGVADAFWSITANPSGPTTAAAYKISGTDAPVSFQFPPWADNTLTSGWVAPSVSYPTSATQNAAGTWVFTTTFTLSGAIPSTASISGQAWADNQVTGVTLNGNSLGIVSPPTGNMSDPFGFLINSGYVDGLNTLSFSVLNVTTSGAEAGAVGFRAEFGQGADTPIPEPATFGLIGLGLLGLAAIRRSRKTS